MYALKIRINNLIWNVQWNEGIITGDDEVVGTLGIETKNSIIGPVGGPMKRNQEIMQDGTAYYLLAKQIFGSKNVRIVRGSLPELSPVPENTAP